MAKLTAQEVLSDVFVDLLGVEGLGEEIRLCAVRHEDGTPRWRVDVLMRPTVSVTAIERLVKLTVDRPVRVDYDHERRAWVVIPMLGGAR